MEMLSYNLDYNYKLYINLAVNVKNSKDLLKSAIQGDLKCALINPKLILDAFQIVVAANRAIVSYSNDKLSTKSIYTDVIFNLSPIKHIGTALNDFGIQENNNVFLVCVIGKAEHESENLADDVCKKIDGTFKFPSSFELKNYNDEKAIVKYYKISQDELNVSDLLSSIVTRIASKGFK